MPRKQSEYLQFVNQFRQQNPTMKSSDVVKYAAQEWRKITGKPKGPKRVKKPKLCPICQKEMRKPRTPPFVCPECKKKLPQDIIKGGFLGAALLGSVAAPLAYDYIVKPTAKKVFGKGVQKKKPSSKKRTARKKKGGLMYLPGTRRRGGLMYPPGTRGGLMYPPGI